MRSSGQISQAKMSAVIARLHTTIAPAGRSALTDNTQPCEAADNTDAVATDYPQPAPPTWRVASAGMISDANTR